MSRGTNDFLAALFTLALLIGCFFLMVAAPADVHAQATISLTWTSPGDDSLTGTANKYDCRWSIQAPVLTSEASKDAWWAGAVLVTGLPAPLVAGSTQTVSIAGFLTGTYYFVIRTKDEANNWSGWSNVIAKSVADAIRPAPITDLR